MGNIVPIVEGEGEVEAIPNLLRKALFRLNRNDIRVVRPFRVSRYKVVKEGEIERALQQAISDREDVRAVIVVLDSDDDNPQTLQSSLRDRCKEITDLPVAVVAATRELEGWFLGGKESLRGTRGIRGDATAPQNPERIRGASEHLSRNMISGRRYIRVDDQPAFATRLDLEMASRRCPSLGFFLSELTRITQLI